VALLACYLLTPRSAGILMVSPWATVPTRGCSSRRARITGAS